MENSIEIVLTELLEAAKNLVISIQDDEQEEALENFAKLGIVNGKLAALLIPTPEESTPAY
jgi:hypothetical protein